VFQQALRAEANLSVQSGLTEVLDLPFCSRANRIGPLSFQIEPGIIVGDEGGRDALISASPGQVRFVVIVKYGDATLPSWTLAVVTVWFYSRKLILHSTRMCTCMPQFGTGRAQKEKDKVAFVLTVISFYIHGEKTYLVYLSCARCHGLPADR
jgi:hypothetical protein